MVTKDKEGQTGSINQEDTKNINIYAANIRASKYNTNQTERKNKRQYKSS